MKNWQLQTAKSKFSELVNTVLADGPQVITRHGKALVVMVPYQGSQMQTNQRSLAEFFLKSPLSKSGLKIVRDRQVWGRELEL